MRFEALPHLAKTAQLYNNVVISDVAPENLRL